MAELTPLPSAQRPADAGYQPISGYAVAAALVAGAFAIILTILVGVSLYNRRTALSYEVLLLAVVGVVLAAIARSQIRNSEGTRTGLRLATFAWWVSVLGGVGFAAYLYANEMALERKSAREAERFFDKLKAGKVHEAFEFLVPPEERGRADPQNAEAFEVAYGPAGFAGFKSHDLVRLIVRSGPAAEFEHTGVKDLGQEGSGFRATHLYRMVCPEGVFDIQVKLVAMESRKGRDLQWFIPGQPVPNFSIRPFKLSQYGRLVAELEYEGDNFAKAWMAHLAAGRISWAHLMTLPWSERKPVETDLAGALVVIGGPVANAPLRRESLPPDRAARLPDQAPTSVAAQARLGFDDLAATGFFRADTAGTALPPEKLTKLRGMWIPPRLGPSVGGRTPGSPGPTPPMTTVTRDAVTVVVTVELATDIMFQTIPCQLGVVCTDPEVQAALDAARAKGPTVDDPGVTLRSLGPRGWRIAWFQSEVESPLPLPGPGGGPPGGPPRR